MYSHHPVGNSTSLQSPTTTATTTTIYQYLHYNHHNQLEIDQIVNLNIWKIMLHWVIPMHRKTITIIINTIYKSIIKLLILDNSYQLGIRCLINILLMVVLRHYMYMIGYLIALYLIILIPLTILIYNNNNNNN